MKLINNFVKVNPEFSYKVIAFKFWGIKIKRKGFDLYKNNQLILTLEPVNYSNGDKWFLHTHNYEFPKSYLKRITKTFLNSIK